jgi:TolB-like protein
MIRTSQHLTPLLTLALAACASTGTMRADPARVAEAEAYARQAIANEQTIRGDSLPARTVGITPLRISATDTALQPLAYGLADLLMTDLARSASLRVVDRLRLDALLRELSLVSAGRVDETTAPRVGRLIQARRLVLGSATQQAGGQIAIEAGIADVVTGDVRAAVSATAPLDDILAAEKELAFKLFDALGVQLTPAERVAVEQRATQNLAALLAYSRGVRYEVEGRFDAAAAEYQSALRLDPGFAMAGTRLGGTQGRATVTSTQVARAAGAAVARVNTSIVEQLAAPPGGPADPSFTTRTVTIIVTITTPP